MPPSADPLSSSEPSTLRVFIALPLPPTVIQQVTDLSRRLQKGFQFTSCRPHWTVPNAYHLTLAFLGDQPAERIKDYQALLASVAARFPPQRLVIKQLGVFPHWHRPRVLWTGVRDRTHLLADLHAEVNRGLKPFGYQPEDRPFHPHLTLARFKGGKDLAAVQSLVHEQIGFRFGPFEVDELVLFRSELHSSGAQYTRLSVHPLTADPAPAQEDPNDDQLEN